MKCFIKIKYSMEKKISFLFLCFCCSIFSLDAHPAFAKDTADAQIVYSSGTYRDPFLSWLPKPKEIEEITEMMGAAQNKNIPPFVVKGVVWGEGFTQAIINDSVVKEGDYIEGAKVLEINKDKIKLSYEDNIFFLSVSVNDKDKK
ncbi:MAG: hypothetical protein COV72_07060 [Candidatus Omnitrophica bacterium CG11_big_fil_rev_8_21_14_0_20_42_13]|uniref:Uncharacterized protein n=1 Tax=Candidatus Ghiorseimicrobium undicola TaxID=1974746 RepID=A0A2H0LW89_9BACT|nr:MAG: hypothetical protein COV72_07060 [Candidatus Omnitrophica bacterium CG11_big_fil_rev_8_21_14_0_20_42_13]